MGIRIEAAGLMFRAAVLAFAVFSNVAYAECRDDRISLRGDWGQADFFVEVADDNSERAQGLMFRETMPSNAGMLFVYDHPQRVAFWMRNTLIPLDMIFADETGLVQKVHANAVPLDETTIPGGDGIQFVLEINGGRAALFGISPGTQLRHPAVDEKLALWKCQ